MNSVSFVLLWMVAALGLTGVSMIVAGLGIWLWRIAQAQGSRQ